MKKLIYSTALLLFSGVVMLLSSCSKQEGEHGNTIVKGSAQDLRIRSLISRLPVAKLLRDAEYQKNSGGYSTQDDSWTFGIPGAGVTFSNGTNSTITVSTGPTVINVSTSAFGANTGGGTVVAGATSLDVNYTFCFTATDTNAVGLNLFNLGNGGFNGVSSVIGVSGDFDQLGTATDSTKFSDIFHGLAFYFVYDSEASGTYDVIDWTDDISDTTVTDGNSFAFVFDFVNGRLFLSESGTITVTGGKMNFNGDYLEVSGFLNEDGDLDLGADADLTYRTVSGYGEMGCN